MLPIGQSNTLIQNKIRENRQIKWFAWIFILEAIKVPIHLFYKCHKNYKIFLCVCNISDSADYLR